MPAETKRPATATTTKGKRQAAADESGSTSNKKRKTGEGKQLSLKELFAEKKNGVIDLT